MIYKIAEKFISINGEGVRSGQLAVFIRFCGCNLKCDFCDTSWVNKADTEYEEMSEGEIVEYVKKSEIHNVTLTGGEPLMQPGIRMLIDRLIYMGLNVEIETNGSVALDRYKSKASFTMDYKLPGSGMEQYMKEENLKILKNKDTIKFVAGDENDLNRFKEILDKYDLVNKCNVYLSPVYGKIPPEIMVEFMKKHKLNGVNLQLQMHKIIWAPDKRGV